MKNLALLFAFFVTFSAFSQPTVDSKHYGLLKFNELDFGLAKVKSGSTEELSNSPTGTHGWLEDFEIIHKTDSIRVLPKANFGIVYIVDSKDTMDIEVVIEWIYPKKITNDKGEKFKSFKYSTHRPTNTPTASSYSLDEPYEMVKGEWKMNIFIEDKQVCSRTFVLY